MNEFDLLSSLRNKSGKIGKFAVVKKGKTVVIPLKKEKIVLES
jgi:hypothetical protein